MYKLVKYKISKKFKIIVHNMYDKVMRCVKCTDGLTDFFSIPVGTRQCCNLSAALFNCYINDLPQKLDDVSGNQP